MAHCLGAWCVPWHRSWTAPPACCCCANPAPWGCIGPAPGTCRSLRRRWRRITRCWPRCTARVTPCRWPALSASWAPLDASLDLWLAIPLRHGGGGVDGCVLVAQPRAPFRLDHEVFGLLRTVAREVATYLAEQRATRVLLETQELRAYGERFAFVAHDIKNVSSQLSLLLSNAETHIANPDFQRDMLVTVAASVQKIGALIRRLQVPAQEIAHLHRASRAGRPPVGRAPAADGPPRTPGDPGSPRAEPARHAGRAGA